MQPRHIYDTEGRWVAFVVNGDVFDRSGDLIARLNHRQEILGLDGDALGVVTEHGHYLSVMAFPGASILSSVIV